MFSTTPAVVSVLVVIVLLDVVPAFTTPVKVALPVGSSYQLSVQVVGPDHDPTIIFPYVLSKLSTYTSLYKIV